MTKRLVLSVCLILVIALAAYTQIPARPYRNGSVWEITFIHTHAGMGNAYLTYLTTDWKREQEAAKDQEAQSNDHQSLDRKSFADEVVQCI